LGSKRPLLEETAQGGGWATSTGARKEGEQRWGAKGRDFGLGGGWFVLREHGNKEKSWCRK